jgi:shikimate kinase
MGTGKSSVGKALARMTGMEFMDLDELIEAETGQSINDIFAQQGESLFRSMETAALRKITPRDNILLSTGGGAVLAAENREIFRSMGTVINLTAPASVICSRLRHTTNRPLLNDGADRVKLEQMLQEREPCYAEADIRIDTTGKKIEDVAAEILAFMTTITSDVLPGQG